MYKSDCLAEKMEKGSRIEMKEAAHRKQRHTIQKGKKTVKGISPKIGPGKKSSNGLRHNRNGPVKSSVSPKRQIMRRLLP